MLTHELIYYIHILIVAPLFIYIGQYKELTNPKVLASLFPMGVIVLVYHSYKLYQLKQHRSISHLDADK